MAGEYIYVTSTTSGRLVLRDDHTVEGGPHHHPTAPSRVWSIDAATGDLVVGDQMFRPAGPGQYVDTVRAKRPTPDHMHSLMVARTDIVTGLRNRGNTCYLAATTQLLRQFDALRDAYPDMDRHVATTTSMRDFVVRESDRSFFGPLLQHDAHEFLMTYIDCLRPDEPVLPAHMGVLRSTAACPTSGESSTRNTPFVVLSIPVAATLQDSLTQLQELETLAPENQWISDGMKAGRVPRDAPTTKRLEIVRLPESQVGVVFHVKRFQLVRGQPRKRSQPTQFPTRWCQQGNQATPLRLRAVVVHHGSFGGGHYTAVVRSPRNRDQWFQCDDARVRPTTLDHARQAAQIGYLVLYTAA